MHEAVTNSSVSTNNFLSAASDDLTTPISRKYRQHTADNFHWSAVHDFGTESTVEPHQNWHLSTPIDDPSAHLTPIRRTTPAGLPKISSGMPTRTENNPSDRTPGASHRWRFNTNGQFVDSESAGWDLADEIVRLKIGEVTADSDEVHGHIRTPPKSKLANVAVAQLSETSPLETSSNTSVGSSPHTPEHQINTSHSRGSSTDTTVSSSQESVVSVTSNTLAKPPLKVNTGTGAEVKERPHSFSGGLSSADLRRLQQAGDSAEAGGQLQQQWAQAQYRENPTNTTEQLSYPSLATHIHRPQPQLHPQMYDYRGGNSQLNEAPAPNRDDVHIDYNTQQRNFNPIPQGLNLAASAPGPAFVQGRPNNTVPGVAYRQPPPRGFPQQGPVASPSAIPYPGGHVSHLSLGNTQQLYDMMMPGPHHEGHHPAVTRVQQQHNIFRPTHHHSASDPSALRDAAALALLNGNMPPFGPGMFQPGMPLPMYPNQYFGAQEQYPLPDAAVMAARLQAQYTGPYAVLPPQPVALEGSSVSSPTSTNGPGPSANNRKLGLYKTELCRSWEEKGSCRYGTKCQFAHGEEELRRVSRHPKYKTEICRTFWVSGSCPYGKRCCFIHTELPTSGATASSGTPAIDSAPPQRPDGRARSLSTNSDPNEANVSILARISAKRGQDPNNLATPVDSGNGFQFSRPPTGSLRVDTSTLDASVKQNKSAYPSFASNGILLPAPEPVRAKSPGPVTAGPDLGRHNNSRREIVGYSNQQQQRTHKTNDSSSSSVRHSLNGSDVDINFSASPPASGHSSYVLSPPESGRVNGHVRAGSAGNWGSFSRNNHFAASAYPHGQSPAGDVVGNSPWAPNDIQGVGTSRLHEKVWA